MLQKPLPVVKPPQTWSDTKWQDMHTTDLTGQLGALPSRQGAPAPKPAGGNAPRPKIKLTGIKIGGKQITLPKAATPPPPAALPEYLNKLVSVVKKANKLLKKPLQPLSEILLSPPAAYDVNRAGNSGNETPAHSLSPSAVRTQPKAADNQGLLEQRRAEDIPAVAVVAHPPEASEAEDAAAPMDFHQWMLASKMAAERQQGPEQDVGRPSSAAAQDAPTQLATSNGLPSAPAQALSPEACFLGVSSLGQDAASPAGSCNARQQAAPLEKPAAASLEDVAGPAKAAAQTSAALQHAAATKQQQLAESDKDLSAEAGPSEPKAQTDSLPQSADAAPAAATPAAAAAAPEQLPGRSSPAGSKAGDDSSSSSSSSDDSSSSSETSSSDSDSSSSDHPSSLSGVPLLSGDHKGSSASKACSASGSKRPVQEACGPSPKRQKPSAAGEPAGVLTRLDSVREDGEIKGERALRDAYAEERERERGDRRTPERYARGSSREDRDRERSYARDSKRRREEDDTRFQRRSDDYYRMHNWKYTGRQRSREPYEDRGPEDDRRRRDRDRGRSVEEERRRRGEERERERERERRRRDDLERRSSYDYRRRSRSRSRDRSRSRQLPGSRARSRSRSRAAEDRWRERSRTGGRRSRSLSRDRHRQSERREASPERRRARQSAEQETTAPEESPPGQQPYQARAPETAAPVAPSDTLAPPAVSNADKAAVPVPLEMQPALVDNSAAVAGTSETPSRANKGGVTPASISAHQAQLSERKAVSMQAGQAQAPPPQTTPGTGTDPSNDLSDAARAFAMALRASIESRAQEGGDTPADLHKQATSRKRLAKVFVERGLDYERQLEALVVAGAEAADCAKLLREMCSATSEGILLTLKAQVHFLRFAAVGERMILQKRGMEWAAAVQDPAAMLAKSMQPKHVLANEYQAFLAELQQPNMRQLYAIAKARFQRAAACTPSEKDFVSRALQFVDLSRMFAMRLEMVTAVRTNAFQAPSLKQHEGGLRRLEDSHRDAQHRARQQPHLHLQQQRGAPGGPARGQQPSPRAFPGGTAAGPGKPPADAGETFQRPSPGDSNNSETTASTPPTVQGLQQYLAAAVPAGAPGLPPLQAASRADMGAIVIPQKLARSQEVLLNSHQRFMAAYDLAASREIQLLLLTVMEDDNPAAARAAALVSAMGVDAALMDVMAVPSLGRQCLDGLRALRDSLGLSPTQGAVQGI